MSVAILMPLMGLEELPREAADATSDGDEEKTNDDKDRGEKISIPAGGGPLSGER